MAGRQDLSWGDTPQGASCPPFTGPSHFSSLPSLFASASPCCAFSSPFLHSSVVLLFKPTAPYHDQNKGEVERWDFELETLGLTLLGLTEEMKVEEMGDFRPPRSLLKHMDPLQGVPLLLQQAWVLRQLLPSWVSTHCSSEWPALCTLLTSVRALPFGIQSHTRLPWTFPMSFRPP